MVTSQILKIPEILDIFENFMIFIENWNIHSETEEIVVETETLVATTRKIIREKNFNRRARIVLKTSKTTKNYNKLRRQSDTGGRNHHSPDFNLTSNNSDNRSFLILSFF